MITCTRSCEESVLLHEKPACSVRQQQTAKSESNDSKQQWRPADVVAIVVVVVVVWLWVCRRRLSFVVASLLLPFDAGGKTARPQKWSWLCLLDTSTSQVMAATLRRTSSPCGVMLCWWHNELRAVTTAELGPATKEMLCTRYLVQGRGNQWHHRVRVTQSPKTQQQTTELCDRRIWDPYQVPATCTWYQVLQAVPGAGPLVTGALH